MRTSENSSDLERAAAARSIAVEFLEVRMAVQKLQRCEYQYFSRSRCTFWDPDSGAVEGGGVAEVRHTVAFTLSSPV